jgi:tRNA-specific 2-thiouridylase
MKRARALGCTRLATGHYARIEAGADGVMRLARARDRGKDQSYFLFNMPAAALSEVLFPLGGMTKEEVRAHAARLGLPNCDKPESQEICFVPDGNYARFIDRYLEAENATERLPGAGEIVNVAGQVIGNHEGIHRYTIGQRRGMGIAGERPLYVISIDAEKNRVTAGPAEELLSNEFTVARANWIAFDDPREPVRAEVRVRYRHTAAPATITPLDNQRARIVFDEPQRAITPGQASVFYRGDEVIGGGWIVKSALSA